MHRYQSMVNRRQIVKTGIAAHLFNEMDNITIKRHLRVTIDQLDMIANTFHTMGLESEDFSFTYKVKTGNFKRTSGQDNIIGAIDGCHIKILKPNIRGQDYINHKSYFSILLQGICDDQKRFTDVFIGVSGKVHDAAV